MDSTTHTTTTVEFVDWRAKAKAKLEAEDKLFKGGRAAKSVQSYVLRTLLGFVDQEPRFAEVVCNTQRTFSECCAAVVNNAGEVLSDLETYRRAVQFYFPNAEVSFSMNIKLTGAPPTEAEMQAPATVKPEEASPMFRSRRHQLTQPSLRPKQKRKRMRKSRQERRRKRLRKTICSFPWMGGSDDFRIQRIQAGADCYARRWQLSVPAGRSEQDRKGKMRQYGLPLLSGSAGLP